MLKVRLNYHGDTTTKYYTTKYYTTHTSNTHSERIYYQDLLTSNAEIKLFTLNLHCVQLDHCTLQFESDGCATLALLALSNSAAYTPQLID
jgi:hypothetical protein